MKQYTRLEFIRVIRRNGFFHDRDKGDHAIYVNNDGRHISLPQKLESVIAHRLIKENNLDTNIKKKRK